MNQKITRGLQSLAAKALAVISASVAMLSGQSAKANPPITEPTGEDQLQTIDKKKLKPQLVLRLSSSGEAYASMHGSHSSHSSHRSHSSHSSHSSHYSGSSPSHSSHSSHYSSSPTYTPPVYTPPSSQTYTPPSTSTYTPKSGSSSSSSSSSNNSSSGSSSSNSGNTGSGGHTNSGTGKSSYEISLSPDSTLFTRTLYKGCKGADVHRLQRWLTKLGYNTLVTGYFGDKTEAAVKKFQVAFELDPDGLVDALTHFTIQNQLK